MFYPFKTFQMGKKQCVKYFWQQIIFRDCSSPSSTTVGYNIFREMLLLVSLQESQYTQVHIWLMEEKRFVYYLNYFKANYGFVIKSS